MLNITDSIFVGTYILSLDTSQCTITLLAEVPEFSHIIVHSSKIYFYCAFRRVKNFKRRLIYHSDCTVRPIKKIFLEKLS